MKKFLIVLGIFLLGNVSFAEQQILSGSVDFDWVNMSQIQRDDEIGTYRKILFGENEEVSYKRKEFRSNYKPFLKDKNFKLNYTLMLNGVTETQDAEFCTFYHKNLLYMYAIKYKNNPARIYYYNGLGTLRYVDEISDNYPNYPYFSKQFRANGKLAGAIYFISKDLQYVYKPDGDFKGVWYKDKMFDETAKLILTRTNW
ncbi:MAG: hypothetical protein KH301_05840 [Brachyspira sp.]|nr:hypothetical protein [Brachyspira sp.]